MSFTPDIARAANGMALGDNTGSHKGYFHLLSRSGWQ